MTRLLILSVACGMLLLTSNIQAQGGCSTLLESIDDAPMEEVSTEFRRLKSYNNPYCDTTGSDFEKLMKKLGDQLVEVGATKDQVLSSMGEPYYQGALADYENQKLTIGRDGKPTGKALPPSYKIPSGDYFIVYLWRKKDYLVFALKGDKTAESRWWEKGKY
ncbi:MAG: hypothetical protein HQ500_13325 [Flavobacteriales bacterium]|nr:hypothetical protein [Flavobacteriales bacterium]